MPTGGIVSLVAAMPFTLRGPTIDSASSGPSTRTCSSPIDVARGRPARLPSWEPFDQRGGGDSAYVRPAGRELPRGATNPSTSNRAG